MIDLRPEAALVNAHMTLFWREVDRLMSVLDENPERWDTECIGFADGWPRVVRPQIVRRVKKHGTS